ncbi:Neuronal cell adhesion molecule [Talaromyces islandicus]|uniref:Neuronal cell adhesion molecule n=1 Tax=Talaromyces islandicus TaxID=28573 RepID=A0A0U1LT08_TALIS|nr:Neuronal cell adhesion molecule [Talaromyces islandicus]
MPYPDMPAPISMSQKEQQRPQHGLSRPWQRVVVRGGIILGLLWSILALSGSHHGLDMQHLQTLWRHPSELSWSDLGLSPSMRRYVSFDLESPVPTFVQSDARCEPGYIFFTPGGQSPMILDSHGDLVWTVHSSAATQNFRVQRYRQQDYLTYWAGKPFGPGYYYMLDSSYNERYVVSPVGDIYGHPHDFTITNRDTALITAHDKRRADLSSVGGPQDGWIFDGVFQEIDIASGELIFEWRSSQHVPIAHSYKKFEHGEGTEHHPFDYFHINNVDQDVEGNYIISAGHTHAVSCIERSTGEVLWNLGGKGNSFRDLGERPMVQFKWPHEARWHDNDTLTVLESDGDHHPHNPPTESRGMLIQLDVPNGVANVRQTFTNPGRKTRFQGNMQLLEDTGNVFVGWGGHAGYSEFGADGTALCEVRFSKSHISSNGHGGPSQISKGPWIGKPLTQPVALVAAGKIFVHWNGATEVAEWQLQAQLHPTQDGSIADALSDAGEFHGIQRVQKTGFETAIDTRLVDRNTKFRIVALDRKGNELGYTNVLELKAPWADATGLSRLQLGVVAGVCLVGGVMTVMSTLHLRSKRSRWSEVVRRDEKR